jgi:hypothetical protein
MNYGNNNNNKSTPRKVIITRKPSISDKQEENNNYTDLDACNDTNSSVTVYSENGTISRCFEFQATVGPNGVCSMQPMGGGGPQGGVPTSASGNKFRRYTSPPPQFHQQYPQGKPHNF